MQIILASDDVRLTQRVRNVLTSDWGGSSSVLEVPLNAVIHTLDTAHPALVLVVLPADPQHSVEVVRAVRNKTDALVMAVGPSSDPRLILKVLHEGGATQYLDTDDLESELAQELKKLQFRSPLVDELPSAPPGPVIAVLSPSGGSGTSTIAANLATSLAQKYGRCGLVDLNLETGDQGSLLDLKPTYTIADFCQNLHRMDRRMCEQLFCPHSSGVALLAAPRTFAEVSVVTPEAIRKLLEIARSLFPYVVVDLNHTFRPEQLEVARIASHVVMPFRLDFASLRNIRRTLESLEVAGVDRQRVRLAVNRYGLAGEVEADAAQKALGMGIAFFIPEDSKTVNLANNKGVPVVLDRPSATVSKSLLAMATSLNGAVASHSFSKGLTSHV